MNEDFLNTIRSMEQKSFNHIIAELDSMNQMFHYEKGVKIYQSDQKQTKFIEVKTFRKVFLNYANAKKLGLMDKEEDTKMDNNLIKIPNMQLY